MKSKIFSTILLTILSLFAQAQITFQKTYGGTDADYGTCVQQTADGGYIIAGSTWSYGPGMEAIYFIKTNSAGDTTWTKVFGGAVSSGGIESVTQTTDGGYIIASGTMSFGAGAQDVYLIKTDVNGSIQWTKTFGGTTSDFAYTIKETADNGYIIQGSTKSFGAGDYDVYLIKTDSTGNPLWKKTYGGSAADIGSCMQLTTDGGYIISGRTYGFGAGSSDALLIKTNQFGDTLWTKTYGGINIESGYFVLQVASGYLLSGYTNSFGAGLEDVFLIKTDTIGNILWSRTFGGINTDVSSWMQPTMDGGFILSGYTKSFGAGDADVYAIRVDALGDTLWTKAFGGLNWDAAYSGKQTSDGGYIFVGQTKNFSTFADVYLIKTNQTGNTECTYTSNANTVIGSPSMVVMSPSMTVTSPAGSTGTTATIVSTGATMNNMCLSVGLQELTPFQINGIAPNPFSFETTIEVSSPLWDATICVYNAFGQKVKELKNISGQTILFQRSNLTSGVYFIFLMQDDKILATNKLVITN